MSYLLVCIGFRPTCKERAAGGHGAGTGQISAGVRRSHQLGAPAPPSHLSKAKAHSFRSGGRKLLEMPWGGRRPSLSRTPGAGLGPAHPRRLCVSRRLKRTRFGRVVVRRNMEMHGCKCKIGPFAF